MTKTEIQAEWDLFIEYPSTDKNYVTTTSALIFAMHIADMAGMAKPKELAKMVCPKCGVDRLKDSCSLHPCAMFGVAQA